MGEKNFQYEKTGKGKRALKICVPRVASIVAPHTISKQLIQIKLNLHINLNLPIGESK